MRYFGSKKSLIDTIANLSFGISPNGVFCDPFGGICTVGSYMKSIGYTVITGDILTFPYYCQRTLLEPRYQGIFSKLYKVECLTGIEKLEKYLNDLIPIEGWIVEEYCRKRLFFTVENGKKIQACNNKILEWKDNNIINPFEYQILITSLIFSFDRVANTAGTYYAYLKKYYAKALKPFVYRVVHEIPGNDSCKSHLMDAEELVSITDCDVLYLDPPYNERNYQRYYHFPETIALGIEPTPSGKSGMFVNQIIESRYNKKAEASIAFDSLIKSSKAKGIIFHYTDDGLIEIETAKRILSTRGEVEEFYYDCEGYSTKKGAKSSVHHILRCQCEIAD